MVNHIDIPDIEDPLSNLSINANEVFDVLYSVDTMKATGPDGISNKFLKMNAKFLAAPLSELFNRSLNDKIFPKNLETCLCCADSQER